MRRIATLFGILSSVGLFGGIFIPLFFPDVLPLIAPLVCGEGGQLIQRQIPDADDDGGVSISHICIDQNGRRSDADGIMLLGLFGIQGVLFGITMLFSTMAARQSRREMAQQFQQDLDNTGGLSLYIDYVRGQPPAEKKDALLRAMKLMSVGSGEIREQARAVVQALRQTDDDAPAPTASDTNLTAKLKELDEARGAGYITQDEYDRKRAEILSEF
jgi:hypothetical protein